MTCEHFLAEAEPRGVSHRLKKKLPKIEMAPWQLEKSICKKGSLHLWTVNAIISKDDAEGLKISYFPKNRFRD